MTPLQKIAMGLVVVVLTAPMPPHPSPAWQRYDVLADPLGWLLVLSGINALTRLDDSFSPARAAAVMAGVLSVPLWFPQLSHQLDPAGSWFVSLPQLGFSLLLARAIGKLAALQRPRDARLAQRFGLLVWGFGIVAVLPPIAIGGGVTRLEDPTVIVAALVNLWLIWSLFSFHRRTWLGGPGPFEVPVG